MVQRKFQNRCELLNGVLEEKKSNESAKLGSNSIEVEDIIAFGKKQIY